MSIAIQTRPICYWKCFNYFLVYTVIGLVACCHNLRLRGRIKGAGSWLYAVRVSPNVASGGHPLSQLTKTSMLVDVPCRSVSGCSRSDHFFQILTNYLDYSGVRLVSWRLKSPATRLFMSRTSKPTLLALCVDAPHQGPVTWKASQCHDVIIYVERWV